MGVGVEGLMLGGMAVGLMVITPTLDKGMAVALLRREGTVRLQTIRPWEAQLLGMQLLRK